MFRGSPGRFRTTRWKRHWETDYLIAEFADQDLDIIRAVRRLAPTEYRRLHDSHIAHEWFLSTREPNRS